jgi:ketosteroid isomerase-like protein
MTGSALQALLDRQAVVDVVADFCHRIDEYDIDGLTDVFTDDCFVDYGPARGGPVTGRMAVLARIASGQAEFRRTQHQLGQSRVHLEGDRADATTYVTATHEDWSGTVTRVHLRYVDGFRRTEHGWRIARRVVFAMVIDGMPGEWRYVEREVIR